VFEQHEPIMVHADADMMKTIVRNFLSNALKFSYDGSEIHVLAYKENDMAVIAVRDHGQGMSEEDQQKLLKTETHFSKYGTNNEEGSGLGLLLCLDFAQKNGGRMWFESKKDEGSTFYFSVPLIKE
jgi:two-component system sensor histidine kinase/response regulator